MLTTRRRYKPGLPGAVPEAIVVHVVIAAATAGAWAGTALPVATPQPPPATADTVHRRPPVFGIVQSEPTSVTVHIYAEIPYDAYGVDLNYPTARTTSSGFTPPDYLGNFAATQSKLPSPGGDQYVVTRGFLEFDTGHLPPGATVMLAVVHMMAIYGGGGRDGTVYITETPWESPMTDANREANYDLVLSTSGTARTWQACDDIVVDTYMESDPLRTAYVNTSGLTKYGLIVGYDIDGSAPPDYGAEGAILYNGLDDPDRRPYLEITYSSDWHGRRRVKHQVPFVAHDMPVESR